jgi:hypothetical protein
MATLVRVEVEKLRTAGLPRALLAVSTALTLAFALLRGHQVLRRQCRCPPGAGPLSNAHGLTDGLATSTYAMPDTRRRRTRASSATAPRP